MHVFDEDECIDMVHVINKRLLCNVLGGKTIPQQYIVKFSSISYIFMNG